jgi:hypothetical protein
VRKYVFLLFKSTEKTTLAAFFRVLALKIRSLPAKNRLNPTGPPLSRRAPESLNKLFNQGILGSVIGRLVHKVWHMRT